MKRTYLYTALAGIAAMTISLNANAEFTVGGALELDTDLINNKGGSDITDADQGGFVKGIFTGTKEGSNGAYVKSVGHILIKKDGSASVDDAYIRIGQNQWGLQFGRWEAMALLSAGTDTILNVIGTAANYQANAARGRTSDVGQITFDYAATGGLQFELQTIWGESDGADEEVISGVRPAISFDVTDNFKVTTGLESLTQGDAETTGAGLYLRYATDAFALKMNVASGKKETGAVTNWENTTYNVNIEAGVIGLGYHATEDDGGDSASTIYGRYYMPDLMGTSVNGSLGFSLASADSVDEDEVAIRYRFNYDF